jgi:hypothetical protein
LTDAEVVTLCVAQVMMGIPSDRRFLRAAKYQLRHLFPILPTQSGLHKRRAKLAATLEWLVGVFASESPTAHDPLIVVDSTPVECGRSVETTRRVIVRPHRQNEPTTTVHLAPIRQRIESVVQTCKDLLSLERHGARTLENLKARIATRLLALAAAIRLNHHLGRPPAHSPTSPNSAESII